VAPSRLDLRNQRREQRRQRGEMARRTGSGYFGRLPAMSHRDSYHHATGGRAKTTTERNLANYAAQSPLSDAGHDVRTRQGYSHGGATIERNDDGSYDLDNARMTELRIALDQASRAADAENERADTPPNQAAADLDQVANIRTGQSVRELHYRWGQGAQTA